MIAVLLDVYQQALDTLTRQISPLQTEYAGHLQCRKGCSGCCSNAFKVRGIEALYLLHGLTQCPPAVQQTVLENLENAALPHCPLLIDGACAVYDHRPVLCRAYGLILMLEGALSTCPLNFNGMNQSGQSQWKTVDLTPYYELLDELSERAQTELSGEYPIRLATIREHLTTLLSAIKPA